MLMATLDKRFLDLSPEDTILKIMDAAIISGCKAPDSQDYFHIITAIEERFSWISTEEFLLAFRLNSYGDYRKKTEHFNLFSMDYMVQVLNAYSFHRAEAITKSEKDAEKLRHNAAKKPTPEEEEQSRAETLQRIKKDYEALKKDAGYEISMTAAKYDILQRLKMVPELTAEEKENYMALAKIKRVDQLKFQMQAENVESVTQFRTTKTILENYEKGNIYSDEQGTLKAIAKGLALVDFFASLNSFPEIKQAIPQTATV